MTPIEGGQRLWNFESYWQSGKVFEGINTRKVKLLVETKKPGRRYPKGKGKKVLYAKFDGFDKPLDYIQAENSCMFQNIIN